MHTASDIVQRVWKGRRALYDLTAIDPAHKSTEIVMSVDLHMILMSELALGPGERPMLHSVAQRDPDAPAGVRIYGMPVRRDPTFADDEIRFRSEVTL